MSKPQPLKTDSKTKGRYERHDALYHAAKKQGYAARSIFKLEEIDKDFSLLHARNWVLDLGCSPGSWLQYVAAQVGVQGGAVGVDLLPLKLSLGPHVHYRQGDIFDVPVESLLPKVALADDSLPGHFDVVLSDMAPNTSGIKSLDQDRSMVLCERALEIAQIALRPGGRFCVKVLEGAGMQDFIAACRKTFAQVKIRRPKGTRAGSMETYVVGLQKK
jgi:23S rRNA (uridine2552-2'-O)-methyltransferase